MVRSPQAPMARLAAPLLLGIAWLAGGVAVGCDAGSWAGWLGMRSIREISAEEARAWLSDSGTVLLQVREPERLARRLPDARWVRPGQELPLAGDERTVVVIASDREAGLRVAAGVSRRGVARVAVVDGGLRAFAGDPARRRAETRGRLAASKLNNRARARTRRE